MNSTIPDPIAISTSAFLQARVWLYCDMPPILEDINLLGLVKDLIVKVSYVSRDDLKGADDLAKKRQGNG